MRFKLFFYLAKGFPRLRAGCLKLGATYFLRQVEGFPAVFEVFASGSFSKGFQIESGDFPLFKTPFVVVIAAEDFFAFQLDEGEIDVRWFEFGDGGGANEF